MSGARCAERASEAGARGRINKIAGVLITAIPFGSAARRCSWENGIFCYQMTVLIEGFDSKEIRLRLAELDSEDWMDDEDSLTMHERALLEARRVAYAKDPEAGSTWEVGGRIRARP